MLVESLQNDIAKLRWTANLATDSGVRDHRKNLSEIGLKILISFLQKKNPNGTLYFSSL